MTDPSRRHGQSEKLLARSGTKVRLALGSALVLTVGAWLTPPTVPQTLSAPQEHAAPLLEEQVQLREASRSFVGVQDIAADVAAYGVAIPAHVARAPEVGSDFAERRGTTPQASGFGVYVSDTLVLTHSAALDGRSAVEISTGDGRAVAGEVAAYEPATGLVLLRTAPVGIAPIPLSKAAPPAGALAVGVGRSSGQDIAMPVFITGVDDDRYTIGTASQAIPAGLPIYTLEGELFAIAAPEGGEMRAHPAAAAAARLAPRATTGERRTSFGIAFQALEGSLTRTFGERGVIVTEVVPGGPADLADIRVGDVLLAVGDAELDSIAAATAALSTRDVSAATPVRVLRGRRVLELEAMPLLAYEMAALARESLAVAGPEARTVFAAAVLETADVPPAARVLAVNGRPVASRAQVQRDLRNAREPLPVLLRVDDRQFFVAIDPAG
jgi:S1-C subfamily serine protease